MAPRSPQASKSSSLANPGVNNVNDYDAGLVAQFGFTGASRRSMILTRTKGVTGELSPRSLRRPILGLGPSSVQARSRRGLISSVRERPRPLRNVSSCQPASLAVVLKLLGPGTGCPAPQA
jgi:hypothetical protein